MKKFYFLLFIYFLSVYVAQSQVVNSNFNSFRLGVDLAYKQLYQYSPFEIEKNVDPVVDTARYHDSFEYYEPFQHNALYFMLGINLSYKNKYELSFKTYYEQRGWSGGVNNTFSYVIFPNFKFEAEDTIFFKKDFLKFKFEMGDLYDVDEFNMGLRNYNIDYQGFVFYSVWRRNKLRLQYSSDLAMGVGLKIDEYVRLTIGRCDSLWAKRQIDYGASIDFVRYNKNKYPVMIEEKENYLSFGAFVRTEITERLNFSFVADYAQSPIIIDPNLFSNTALSMYFTYSLKRGRSLFFVQPKYRFYGINYIFPHYDSKVSWGYDYLYRHQRSPYVPGLNLYPLKNYFRPVSQWALYTEYRDVNNVSSLELRINWDWNIYKKLHHRIELELFNIHRITSIYGNQHTYVFFTSYLYLNLFPGFDIGLYISNKQMNLDVHYQTFYQMKYPFFGFHFTYDGAFDIKTSKHHSNRPGY